MKGFYSIEVSSDCNLACGYCPSPTLKRKKELMSEETWQRCLYWLGEFRQDEVHLNGLGEPLLHPNLPRMVGEAKKLVRRVTLSTNGVLMTPALARELKPLSWITISRHAPKAADRAAMDCMKAGLKVSFSDPVHYYRHNWAGESPNDTNYPPGIQRPPCFFLRDKMAAVLADGRLVACCIDGNGYSARGSVWDDLRDVEFEPFRLCLTCHHEVPEGQYPKWRERLTPVEA